MHNPKQLLYITVQKNYWDDYHKAVENQNNKILAEIKTNDISKLLTSKLISKITNKPNLYILFISPKDFKMKPLNNYHKPNDIWVQKTKTNAYITDIDYNDLFISADLFKVIDKILKNNFKNGYLILSKYYSQK